MRGEEYDTFFNKIKKCACRDKRQKTQIPLVAKLTTDINDFNYVKYIANKETGEFAFFTYNSFFVCIEKIRTFIKIINIY